MTSVLLGHLHGDESELRDAVHVPVISVEAGEALLPGQPLRFEGRKAFAVQDGDGLVRAVVDPFLREKVRRGERFYALLHTYDIYGLRHEWEHIDFPRQVLHVASESEKWLRAFADRWRVPYEEMIQGAVTGDGVTFGHDFHPPEDQIEPAFWEHLSKLTGRDFSEGHREDANAKSGCSC